MKKYIFTFLMFLTINFLEGQTAECFSEFIDSWARSEEAYDNGIDACNSSSYSFIGKMLCKSEQYTQRKIEQDCIMQNYDNC